MLACAAHPAEAAGWRCTRCAALLCPDCAGFREAGRGRLDLCLRCGALAQPLLERRAVLQPFGPNSLADAVRWPFTRETALSALACGLVLWLFGKGGAVGALVADGLVVSFLFHVAVSAARGERELLSAGEFRGFFETVLGPLFRALFASVWAWGPLVVWVVVRGGGFFANGDVLQPRALTSATPVLLALGGALLFPMALLAGALGAPLAQVLNPLVILGYPLKLGRDYALVAGFALLVSLAESALLAALGFVDARVVGLPDVLQDTALLFPPLMLFRALGLLVRARGDELGYGGAEAYLEPVLGAAAPRTRVEDAPPSKEPSPARAPEPLPLGAEPLPALALARALSGGDAHAAVPIFVQAARDIPPSALSAQAWLALAAACAQQQRHRLALLALRRAVEVAPEGPLAPQAWLRAARLCDEALHDPAQSEVLLGELARRHPATPEGRFAASRLAARRSG